MRRSLASSAVEHSWLIGLAALIVYVALAAPNIVYGDGAEFATLGALGGRAHPTGYPLYVLWLRAWAWLPGTTPAHTAAIATAILGALTIGVLHAACRAWGARPIAAMIAVAVVAAAPIVLRYHTEAEVFAMNGLVAALVLWLAAAGGPLRGRWRGAALGVVAGLGLANHLSCVLVAPIGLYGVVRAARESRATTYAVAVLGLAMGLLPYGYLVIADGPASWGSVTTPGDLLAIVLRTEYGTTSLAAGGVDVPWTDSIAACLATIGRSWLWVPAVAGGAMLGVRVWRPAGESRWAWALLAASTVLAGPLFASRFNIEPHGLGLQVCERFHLLPTLLLAVPIAAALDLACARVVRPLLATGLAVLGFAALSIAGLPRLAQVHSPAIELGVHNLLQSLPRDAIAVVLQDDQCLGGRYLQLLGGERPDVAIVCAGLARQPWYRAALAARGLAIPPSAAEPLGIALVRTGRPVFVDRGLRRILSVFRNYPFGVLYRVLPESATPPSPSEVAAMNRDVYRAFDVDYPRPGVDDGLAAVVHYRYASSWAAIARLLDAAGDRGAALDAFEVARSLQPVREDGRTPPPLATPAAGDEEAAGAARAR